MHPRHISVATWIAALAGIVAIVGFVTGKQRLADFFASMPTPTTETTPSPSPPTSLSKSVTTSVTLAESIELAYSGTLTDLQKETLNERLSGKTVTLSGYLNKAQRQGWNYFAEIAVKKDASQTFHLNIDPSDYANWAELAPGSRVEVSTTLKLPTIGTMVGIDAKLLPLKR